MSSTGRLAFVTGAGQGIGAAIARRLHADGFRVAVTDADAERAQAVATGLDPRVETALALTVDVRSRDQVERALATAESRLGPVEVLVNNAARTVRAPLWEIEPDEWDDVLAVNLRGALFGCQVAGPRLQARGHGRIVNVASLAGQQGGRVAGAHYSAAKAGMLVLTKIVAAELAGSGVTCNAVAPAAIRTPALEAARLGSSSADRPVPPVGRIGESEEVAALVAFLCSDDAGFITGATYDINGGAFMR